MNTASGGFGITGNNLTITNVGTISGGKDGDADYIADAIHFTGGTNRLELHSGFTINGNVSANTGSNNTLALGGSTNGTFDISEVGIGKKYQGFESFEKTGTGTWFLNGDGSSFSGTTNINGGTLSVGGVNGVGMLGGIVNVNRGATLSGTGAIGDQTAKNGVVTVANGGFIAPGNSVGTLTINGDLTLSAGSRYLVEVDPSSNQSDLLDVTGTANIGGGSVVHVGANGSYKPYSQYTILKAGSLTGKFADISSDFAFLNPELVYGSGTAGDTVTMILERNDVGFTTLANTSNQHSVANALESLPLSNALLQQILTLPDGAPTEAFNSLSGEMHATTPSALYQSSTIAPGLAISRLRNNLTAGYLPGAPLASAGDSIPAAAMPQSAALPLWAEIIGGWQHIDGDDNAAALKQSTTGIFIGGDHGIGQGWRLGAALGYSDSRIRVNDRDSKTDVKTYSATLYGGKAFYMGSGKLNLMLGAGYSRHSIDTSRQTNVGSWHHTLKSDYSANTTQLFGELGYALPVGQASTVEPFAGLAWNRLHSNGFTETGGPTALTGKSHSQNITTSTVGLRASTTVELGDTAANIYGTVGWLHAFGNVTPKQTLALDGSQPFTVAGVPIARNSAILELGADVAVSATARLGVSYNGELGSGNRNHTGKVYLQWKF